MTDRKFIQLMTVLKNNTEPDKVWSEQTKNFLLAQIPERKPVWSLNLITNLIPVNLVLRPVAAFSMVLALVFISSFASINASRNSLPGDVFYPIKLTAENLKYTLSFSQEGKARMAMSMLQNRVSELKTITLKDEPVQAKQEKIVQATSEITNNLRMVVDKVKELDKKQTTDEQEKIKVSMAVKEINDKLITVKDEMQVALEASLDEEVDKQIERLTSEIEKTSSEFLAVLNDKPVSDLKENTLPTEAEAATSTNTTTVTSLGDEEKQNNGTSSDDFIQQLLEETNREIKEPEFKVGITQ